MTIRKVASHSPSKIAKRTTPLLPFAFCLLPFAFFPPPLAADTPTISYSKSFPGSTPAYVAVNLARDGAAEYREAPDDKDPIKFQVPEQDVAAIFGLAEKLGYFNHQIESGLKVANMGQKTFRYTDGKQTNEVKFNYSAELEAQQLLDWFERITETQLHLLNLERTARFDRLGVNKVLLQIEASWDRKRIVAPEQFLKMLERVAKNESYLHMARERAAKLADAIRSEKAKAE